MLAAFKMYYNKKYIYLIVNNMQLSVQKHYIVHT